MIVRVKVTIKYLAASVLIALTLIGCSSSSSTTRYGNNHTDEDNNSSGRFSSDNDYVVVGEDSVSIVLFDDLEDSGDLPDDDALELSQVMNTLNTDEEVLNSKGTPKEKMLMEIIRYLNTPYKYGGNTKKGIDCSAFTQQVYKNTLSVKLERSARYQYRQGKKIKRMEDLQFGDLVFFDTRKNVKPGHVGIYIGDHLFAHASSKKGVTISSLKHSYYRSRFMGGRRIEPEGTF